MKNTNYLLALLSSIIVLGMAACTTRPTAVNPDLGTQPEPPQAATTAPAAAQEQQTTDASLTGMTRSYTLLTQLGGDPAMAFIGQGGDIDGVVNPELNAEVGDMVELTVINQDPIAHDLTLEIVNLSTGELTALGQEGTVSFVPSQPGTYTYFCSVPGHYQAGMTGVLTVTGEGEPVTASAGPESPSEAALAAVAPAAEDAVSVVRNPSDVPPPIGVRSPETVIVELETIEVNGQLADGSTYTYWTFNGQVPGPMIRVRVGDTIELHLQNHEGSVNAHSIDLHAVTGPGGGAVYTQTLPGEHSSFTFKALNPGLFVYHCATPSVANHISNGMYGLILVEPEEGLPAVDREFYMMQGEIYTQQPFGTAGHLSFDYDKMLHEDAEYLVFNGAAGGLTTDENALQANLGETVRIYFGVGGPNYTSSFHVIGEIFDRVYDQASLTSDPLTDVQTTTVAPGGATMVEFMVDVPGRYILVDHALSRLERGLVGFLYVEGEDNPEVFYGEALTEGSGH